jgi:hypothetical protein
MEDEHGYTQEEKDFVGSLKALMQRYNVKVNWVPVSDVDENEHADMDYWFYDDVGNVNLMMAQIVYGDTK